MNNYNYTVTCIYYSDRAEEIHLNSRTEALMYFIDRLNEVSKSLCVMDNSTGEILAHKMGDNGDFWCADELDDLVIKLAAQMDKELVTLDYVEPDESETEISNGNYMGEELAKVILKFLTEEQER